MIRRAIARLLLTTFAWQSSGLAILAPAAAAAAPAPQAAAPSRSIKYGELTIDLDTREGTVGYKPLELTFKEFELLAAVARHPDRVFTRDQLFSELWGSDFLGESRTVDVHIRYLREKLEADPSHPRHILTVRGVGYRLVWE